MGMVLSHNYVENNRHAIDGLFRKACGPMDSIH